MRRCYGCDEAEALYGATVDFDLTPEYLLCAECAARERAWDSIIEIHTLRGSGGRMAEHGTLAS